MGTDQIKIETEFMKGIISKTIERAIWNFGYVIKIQISELNAMNENGEIDAHLKANIRTRSGKLPKS